MNKAQTVYQSGLGPYSLLTTNWIMALSNLPYLNMLSSVPRLGKKKIQFFHYILEVKTLFKSLFIDRFDVFSVPQSLCGTGSSISADSKICGCSSLIFDVLHLQGPHAPRCEGIIVYKIFYRDTYFIETHVYISFYQ